MHLPGQGKSSSTQTLQALIIPECYIEAEYVAPATWSTTLSTLSNDISSIIQPNALRFQPDELMYTSGSRKEVPNRACTSSGIYRNVCSAPLSSRVKPYSSGVLNSVNRAELTAMLMASRECRPKPIATNSIQELAKHLRLPSATVNDCYRPVDQADSAKSSCRHADYDPPSQVTSRDNRQ